MNTINTKKAYKAPRARVVEMTAQGILCGSLDGVNSNGGIDPYEREDFELD